MNWFAALMPSARLCRKRGQGVVALILLAAALLLAAPVPAQAQTRHMRAQLIAEGPARAGESVTLAIVMTPEPGWHGYWINPGDAGQGITAEWTLSAGASAGPLDYPVPGTLLISGLMNHVYEHEYAVLVRLKLPRDAAAGAVLPVRLKARWLICSATLCVPEGGELAATVRVGAGGAPDPRFDEWRRALPAPLGSKAAFAVQGSALRIGIPLPAAVVLEDPHFFPLTEGIAAYAAPQRFSRKGDLLIVELAAPPVAPIAAPYPSGVLRLNRAGDGVSLDAVPGAVPADGTPLAPDSAAPGAPSLALLLLAALAGGLLLNIMPCVFPILSLKALSLARAGESQAQARAEGLAYGAGVVLACLALGALLLALRGAGQQVGWAFQLQEPVVVAGLLLLAAAITANLLGLYEFAVPGFAGEGSPQGAFATGLLAAFAATPCTGPFMAAAMGAALLLPVAPALALFAALGLGIALPFVAIAFIPALRRALPRPGPWMARFRTAMALPMALTALALVWLESRLAGTGFALLSLGFVAALALALRRAGARQRRGSSARVPALAALGIAFAALALLPLAERSPAAAGQGLVPTRPFSEAALAAARAQGKPVFVWFTADWCLTCKVNEQVAIERESTRAAFARGGVVVLKGDWTRRDPAITRYLTAHGAAGVPLYMWYPAGSTAPRQLPQILTPETLTALVR